MALALTSSAFAPDGPIPSRYTCEGMDLSPPLDWSGVPEGTRSFVLIVDDPDAPDPAAPKTTWVHWVLYDLPGDTRDLPEGRVPAGAREGINDFKQIGYRGPCPPIGRHRYVHKLYALNTVLGDLGAPSKRDMERAMEGHVLAHTQLVGTYRAGHGSGR
jgi:Raf kinase inhibitor-like YbhB/YbcL family protein